MTTARIALSIAVAAFVAFASTVHAARPLVTDDARVVDPSACQVESWLRKNRDSAEYWVLPACNFTGNLELTFGGARTRDSDGSGTYASDIQVQGKTLFKALESNGWGIGLVAGTVRHPQLSARDWFAYAPMSFSFSDDRIVVHVNAGWVREGESGRHHGTWGIGSETRLHPRLFFIAEVYGQNQGKAAHQVGVRYWIVPDRVQLDATYGNTAGDRIADRWFSIGLRFLSPAFLPAIWR